MSLIREMIAKHAEVFGLTPRQQLYDALLGIGWGLVMLMLLEASGVLSRALPA